MRIYGRRSGRNNMVGLLARSYMYNSRGKKDIYEEIENRKWKDMGKGWKIAIGILWGLVALEFLIILIAENNCGTIYR